MDFDHPERSHVAFRVDAGSADVGSPGFSDYVKSRGWLDAERHPSIDFVSREVRKLDERTVHVGFAAHTSINRLEYGMNAGFPVVARDVMLDISTETATP